VLVEDFAGAAALAVAAPDGVASRLILAETLLDRQKPEGFVEEGFSGIRHQAWHSSFLDFFWVDLLIPLKANFTISTADLASLNASW
jgi:hypothetical protein